MKSRVMERTLKNWVLKAEISINRRLGREFIPAAADVFCIETSSACNLKCRFCAYEKKQGPRTNMSQARFMSVVDQAVELGYKEFHLTPCTGDVFMDKQVFEKFEFMDAHPKVRAYHFFTNLTILDDEQIDRLLAVKKLTRLTVSIYGHDESSFIALTDSSAKLYRRLMSNLDTLLARRAKWPFELSIGFRSTFDALGHGDSDLLQMLARYRANGVGIRSSHGIYNNWGGYITQDDVAGLNIRILSAEGLYKSGACVKLFDSFQVTASGVVNGCSCRDVDTTLKIGHVDQAPLRDILSGGNPDYRKIIDAQQSGDFQTVCKSCDYYRSIYHQPSNYRKNKIPTRTMSAFLDKMGQ